MKNINITILLLVLFSVYILGCDRNKSPEEILTRSDELRSQINSCAFTYIDVNDNGDAANQIKYKCYAKWNTADEDEFILMLRFESEDGKILTYDGDTYRAINPEKEKVFVVTRRYDPARFVKRFARIVEKVMLPKPDEDNDKASDDKLVVFDGTSRVGGILCDIISKSGPAFDENSSFHMISYIGVEDGITRKQSFTIYANGLKIQYDKTILKDIHTNIELHDSLFTVSIPKDYKLDKYSPPKSSGKGESSELLGIGQTAPDWTLLDGNGDSLSLSDMLGRPVVLDFWGTWCVWCVVAMPKINTVHERYASLGVNIIGISCREPDGAEPVKFMEDRGMKYKVVLNGDSVAKAYNVRGFPTLYVVGSDGKIVFAEAGYRDDIDSVLSAIIEADSAVAGRLDTIVSAGELQ